MKLHTSEWFFIYFYFEEDDIKRERETDTETATQTNIKLNYDNNTKLTTDAQGAVQKSDKTKERKYQKSDINK